MTHQDAAYRNASRRLGQYLDEKGMRVSVERQTVLQFFCSDKRRWTTAELVEEAGKKHICRATVYNALRVLTESETIRITKPAGIHRHLVYELNEAGQNRIQMVCTRCNRQVDLKDTGITRLVSEKKYNNFVMRRFELVVYGECKVCRRKRK